MGDDTQTKMDREKIAEDTGGLIGICSYSLVSG